MDFNIISGSTCDQCHKVNTLGILREPVSGYPGVFDLSILCQQCGRHKHSCFTSVALDVLSARKDAEPKVRKRMKLVERHKREFEHLQQVMAERNDHPYSL